MPKLTRDDIQVPEELTRFAGEKARDVDLARRTVRNTVTTKAIARDGGIVLPGGIITRFFEENPVVKIRHGMAWEESRPLVAGRALELVPTADGLDAVTQFADNELGREWGYMYGLNEEGETYMRAFSFGWSTIRLEWWGRDRAMNELGKLYDPEVDSYWFDRYDEVWVAAKSEMHEYSVVEVGADRNALKRLWQEQGIRAARDVLTNMDLGEARKEIGQMRAKHDIMESRLRKLEQLTATGSDFAAEGARGDAAEVAGELRGLLDEIRGKAGGRTIA